MAQTLMPPIMRLNDDIIENIAEASLRDEDGRCDYRRTRTLSQVCQRWRELILDRASFWNDLNVLDHPSPSAFRTIMERSRSTPLHISLPGLSDELLQALPAERLVSAFSLKILNISEPYMDNLAAHVQTGELPQLQRLQLENFEVLVVTLQNAVNLENLHLIDISLQVQPESSSELFDANTSRSRLRVLKINSDQWYFRLLMNLVSRVYPLPLSDVVSVELRCWADFPVAELGILQFATADRLVLMERHQYLVSYPADAIKTLQFSPSWIPPGFAPHFPKGQAVYRGFDCIPNYLEYAGLRRQAMCHILSTVRSIVLCMTEVQEVIDFLVMFDCETFALVEEIQILLQVSVQDIPRISPRDDVKGVTCPRLETLSISIDATDRLDRGHMDFALVGHLWGSHCEALVNLLEVPPGTTLNVHAQCDGVSHVDTIMRKLLPSAASD